MNDKLKMLKGLGSGHIFITRKDREYLIRQAEEKYQYQKLANGYKKDWKDECALRYALEDKIESIKKLGESLVKISDATDTIFQEMSAEHKMKNILEKYLGEKILSIIESEEE